MIEQDGCCPANVTLNKDTVTGSVNVFEGVGNGDQVTAAADNFGPTTIVQYYGPLMSGHSGSGDTVNINQNSVCGRHVEYH